ncbi:hypothetical protein [Saccharospirillum salsuginis]|uniref:Uncharacterized protein n=1 Tax=Saccharospirillum salsuginis TaxID=418750 RepID=A0A918NF69_9GAMM|nr:hypothetical protein [Saccharospirillum salsuginis]GGX62737.1 hypothetical protein GCM10007392_33300 [Saccharospirillum salsuginis]
MTDDEPSTPTAEPTMLHERAADNLRYIRETMESTGRFTELSGLGYVLIGLSAVLAWLAAVRFAQEAWLSVWMFEFAVATAIGLWFTARKAVGAGVTLWDRSARKLLLAFSPPMAAGGLFTVVLYPTGDVALIQGIWLSLYGVSVITGGLFSVGIVPVMGLGFMAAGAVALLWPATTGWMMLLGFGGLHGLFGVLIWRRYGG